MWYRPALAAFAVLVAASSATAQGTGAYSRAVPPDRAVLDRLNLRTEWSVYLPIESKRDSIATVQTFDDQVFIQSRRGLVMAVNARTGKVMWTAALGDGDFAYTYPAAVNSRFVFVAHVTRLYAFYRETGVVEFSFDLGSPPTTGLTADEETVYAVLSARAGMGGIHRVSAFVLPPSLFVPDPSRREQRNPDDRNPNAANRVDELVKRYPTDTPVGAGSVNRDVFELNARANLRPVASGGLGGTRTPSLAVTQSVAPPYNLDTGTTSPSLAPVSSLRQPYRIRDDNQRDIQRTPSLSTIPPSVGAALALTNLRPQGVQPRLRWEAALETRIIHPVLLTPQRAWGMTDLGGIVAVSKLDRVRQVLTRLSDNVSAPPGQAGTTGYFPLADGNLMAIDLSSGDIVSGATVLWRTSVGGLMSRTPVVTASAVYAAGDASGVGRVDRATGELTWKTDGMADRVLAVNQEFVYIRDRRGRILVYDARRATDPARKMSVPLSGFEAAEFNVPVVNTVSDRLYLAAENGLLVSLRDATAKYAQPMRMAPEILVNLPKPEPKKDGMPPATPPVAPAP